MSLRVLDLFAGIGGFTLGLERVGGFATVAFCEADPFARAVLAKHWPAVPCFDDVRTLCWRTGMNIEGDNDDVECAIYAGEEVGDCAGVGTDQFLDEVGPVDVVTAGFPCQDVSPAGGRRGLAGARSGLWRECARIVGELRPRYLVVENSADLVHRGLERVLADLAALGYDAEWSVVSACALGFPHTRERMFVVAYAAGERRQQCGRLQFAAGGDQARDVHQRFRQSGPVRVAAGVPHRVDRNRCLGNAVVPQVVEMIGRAILVREGAASAA